MSSGACGGGEKELSKAGFGAASDVEAASGTTVSVGNKCDRNTKEEDRGGTNKCDKKGGDGENDRTQNPQPASLPRMTTEEALLVLNRLVERGETTECSVRCALDDIRSGGFCVDRTSGTQPYPLEKKSNLSASSLAVPDLSKKRSKKKKEKTSVLDLCRYRHVAIRLSYDGSSYSGFAENVNRPEDESVERALFAALVKTCLVRGRQSCGYSRCGRTDRGVSAFGQVVALRLRSKIPVRDARGAEIMDEDLPRNSFDRINVWCHSINELKHEKAKKRHNDESTNGNDEKEVPSMELLHMTEMDYCRIINGVLPETIRAIGWCPVTQDFSARFSARDRTYRYFFAQRHLDLEKMQAGLDRIVGKHDFRNLCKMDAESISNFQRLILEARVVLPSATAKASNGKVTDGTENKRQICHIEIRGQAFLWHMIRCIAAVAFMIGRKDEEPSVFTDLLDISRNPGKPSYPMAPDLPLVLHCCNFRNLTFGHSARNLWDVTSCLERRWEEAALAAERARNALDSLSEEATVKVGDLFDFAVNCLVDRKRRRGKKRSANISFQDNYCLDDAREVLNEAFANSWDSCGNESTVVERISKSEEKEKDESSVPVAESGGVISWGKALCILKNIGHVPSPTVTPPPIHIPIMDRAKGMSYDEKVRSMTGKKRGRYEENLAKQQTKEVDQRFYEEKAMEGGSGI